jgi:hypothetical protein
LCFVSASFSGVCLTWISFCILLVWSSSVFWVHVCIRHRESWVCTKIARIFTVNGIVTGTRRKKQKNAEENTFRAQSQDGAARASLYGHAV